MTQEERQKIHEVLNRLIDGRDLSVEEMEEITEVRSYVDREDESAGALAEWEEKYKSLETVNAELTSRVEESERKLQEITDAYRKRWDESFVGTKVNGEFVEKTVEEVPYYTYEWLMGRFTENN